MGMDPVLVELLMDGLSLAGRFFLVFAAIKLIARVWVWYWFGMWSPPPED